AAIACGADPVTNVFCTANDGVSAPGTVVFKSTDTVLSSRLATTRSGLPSPLTSASATDLGLLPVAKVTWEAKAVAVCKNTDKVPSIRFVTTRSGCPSPLTSPTAALPGELPVAKVCCGGKSMSCTENVKLGSLKTPLPKMAIEMVAVAEPGANVRVP